MGEDRRPFNPEEPPPTDRAICGPLAYPERAAFIVVGAPSAGHDIERAADEGFSVVLVSADGGTRVLKPELQTRWFNDLPLRVSSRSHRRRNPVPRAAVLQPFKPKEVGSAEGMVTWVKLIRVDGGSA